MTDKNNESKIFEDQEYRKFYEATHRDAYVTQKVEKRLDDFSYRDNVKKNLIKKFSDFSFITEADIEAELVKADNTINFTRKVLNTNRSIMDELNKNNPNYLELFQELRKNISEIKEIGADAPFVSYVYEINFLNTLKDRISAKMDTNEKMNTIYDISCVNSKFNELDLAHYMAIDNTFYFKIAEHMRIDEENKDIDTLITLTSNKNSNIYKNISRIVRKVFNMYLTDYEMDEMIKNVFISYYGDVPMNQHIIKYVKKENSYLSGDILLNNELHQINKISNHELVGKLANMNSVIHSNDPMFVEFNKLKFDESLSFDDVVTRMNIDENRAMDYYIIALNEINNLVKPDKNEKSL